MVMIIQDIISAYEDSSYIAQLNYIECGGRLIHHDYLIGSDGEVRIRVNGSLLDELVTEKLSPHQL